MGENSFKSIRNATIAAVIAGIILLSIPVLRGYAASLFNWLWSGVKWCWSLLFATYALPGWAWLFILLLSLVGATNIYLFLRGEREEPEYKSYVKDFLYGAKWRWNWVSNHISNLWCFCPTCDATLVYNDYCRRNPYTNQKTDFMCENCNNRVVTTIDGGDKNYAIGAVEREIHRRIRTGEYKKH